MAIPIQYQNEHYFIVDKRTLALYNSLFAGFIFIGGNRYKKYVTSNRKLLLEV